MKVPHFFCGIQYKLYLSDFVIFTSHVSDVTPALWRDKLNQHRAGKNVKKRYEISFI
jgi:hypothetical protein